MSDDTFKGDILGGVSGVTLNISRGNSNRLFEGKKLGTVNTIGLVLALVVSRVDLLVCLGGISRGEWRRTCELYLHVFYGIESLLEMGQNLEFWGSNPRFEPQKRGKDQHPPQEHSTELCVAYRGLEMLRR